MPHAYPDDNHDARLLIRQLEDDGVKISVTVMPGSVVVHAVGTNGQTHRHERDDGDLLAAVCEVAERVGLA